MSIAILGWGSLIWDKRDLPIAGDWKHSGPVLPIGFSRISSDGRLTLLSQNDVHPKVTSGLDLDRVSIGSIQRFLGNCQAICRTANDKAWMPHADRHSLDRLARNVEDLRGIVRELKERRVSVEFVKNYLTFSGGADPTVRLVLNVLGGSRSLSGS